MDPCLDSWPEPVREQIRRAHGTPLAVERLGGMSVARVFRVRADGGSFIVKSSPRPAEAMFYEHVADRLRQAGVPIPTLLWVAHLADVHWLFLEDVPTPLPVPAPDQWQPDPRVMTALARLHRATRAWHPDFPAAAGGRWTEEATDAALTCFPPAVAEGLVSPLRALRREADRLQHDWCWISGDPSPPNWGLRDDGSVALFDWELFRPGVPAGDLAPTVPGLGDARMFREAARAYLAACGHLEATIPWSTDELARDVAVAKLATVILLLRESLNGEARVPAELVTRLVEQVPAWVRKLESNK